MEKSDEQKKMYEILKQLEEEQMRLHPEIYNKPTNDEVVNN
jgi:hypothetical protein